MLLDKPLGFSIEMFIVIMFGVILWAYIFLINDVCLSSLIHTFHPALSRSSNDTIIDIRSKSEQKHAMIEWHLNLSRSMQ